MEAKSTHKVLLIFLYSLCLTMIVLWLSPRRVMKSGGCGPRALHAAALTFGKTMTERETLDLFPNHGFEVSIGEMEEAAPKLGLGAESRQMSINDLKREKPIGVLHIDDVHFVAVVGYEGDVKFRPGMYHPFSARVYHTAFQIRRINSVEMKRGERLLPI